MPLRAIDFQPQQVHPVGPTDGSGRGTRATLNLVLVGYVNRIMAGDERDHLSLFQGTLADIPPSPIFSSDGPEDGDHQLFANPLIHMD